MLVLRHLITMDKQDIIKLSAKIGTEDYAKTMPEYCGVISDRPTTAAKLGRVLQEEANFNFDVLNSAVSTCRIIKIDEVLESQMSVAEVEVVAVPGINDVVVDIRHPDECDKKPLMLTNNEIDKIPFFELMSCLEDLSRDKNYLLYCEHGSMSQLHARHLNTMGYSNIKVYQPSQ
jgi:thiamine biosynthesis protein ThiI